MQLWKHNAVIQQKIDVFCQTDEFLRERREYVAKHGVPYVLDINLNDTVTQEQLSLAASLEPGRWEPPPPNHE